MVGMMEGMRVGSPLFLLCAVVVGFCTAWCISKLSRFYQEQIDGLGENRYDTLDGLRGFAAFGVFLSHMVLTQHFHATGDWSWEAWNPGGAYIAARVGVYLFFMLTGFLFWGRLIDGGRSIDWSKLFEGRVRRIVPLYLFCVLLSLIIVAIKSDFILHVPLNDLFAQIATWLSFTFVGLRDINAVRYSALLISAGVFWTLAYEWRFYIALPFLALFLSRGRFLFLAGVGVVLTWLGTIDSIYLYFLTGMIVSYLVRIEWLRELATKPIMTGLAFASCGAIFYFEYSGWPLLLHLFIVFAIASLGNSMGGLLLSRPAKLLGLISYSVYLLHLMALYVFGEVIGKITPIKLMPVEVYWMWMVPVIILVIGGSAITYRLIEYPVLRRGSRKTRVGPLSLNLTTVPKPATS